MPGARQGLPWIASLRGARRETPRERPVKQAAPPGPARPLDPVLRDWLAQHDPRAAFLRRPDHDGDARPDADLDLLVFDDMADDLLVQRHVATGRPGAPTLDLLRLPARTLDDPGRLASTGLITHRLITSDCVHDRDGQAKATAAAVSTLALTHQARAARLASFLELGALTVREIGVTRDWPGLSLFWLHMANSALLATCLDLHGLWCPNVYTRPLDAARRAEPLLGPGVHDDLVARLRLDCDPAPLARAVAELHAMTRSRCPEPVWPAQVQAATRQEFRYWSAPEELQERLAAAGTGPAAVFYLRYVAYSVLRVAMLHQRAVEGWPHPLPFLRPETEVRPDLVRHHPSLLPLADSVFGDVRADELDVALQQTLALHALVRTLCQARGLGPDSPREWRPFEPASRD